MHGRFHLVGLPVPSFVASTQFIRKLLMHWDTVAITEDVNGEADAVLHGESSKRLATPRNTKDKKHLQSTQSA